MTNPAQFAAMLSIALFAALLGCLEIGFRTGRSLTRDNPDLHEGTGAVEAAVFALLGLLLAFSFSGATSRLDTRRELIVREANAIGTAYLRTDLLPAADQPGMRILFRRYLDARIGVYAALPDLSAAERKLAECTAIQQEIWSQAITASRRDETQNATRLLLPALNEMIDVTSSRAIALRTHLPLLIMFLLIAVALLSGLLAGYGMAKRRHQSWLHMVVYAAVVSLTVYAVLDMDYPRSGLIRLDSADRALLQLRDSIR